MIVVTGAAGFIGSCLVKRLNEEGCSSLLLVDDFSNEEKNRNLGRKSYSRKLHRDEFVQWLKGNHARVEFVFHIGARTDTTEFNVSIFNRLNLEYTKAVWEACARFSIPLVYASSAATYGLGEWGYTDDHAVVERLRPLNPYGESKNNFDRWALAQEEQPPFWAGLKFFNVYGPNEYHKGRMASVIFHAYRQIKEKGKVKLFRSHNPKYRDGEQLRDFVYVKDVVDVCIFLMYLRRHPGLYNLGSGRARTFLDLAKSTFSAMQLDPDIEFVDTPADIRDKYQYFTEANMAKLRGIGYTRPFYELEEGVKDYVKHYLSRSLYY
jgi:ADP-L-glycero-D-manno-heptose 6-epimerase